MHGNTHWPLHRLEFCLMFHSEMVDSLTFQSESCIMARTHARTRTRVRMCTCAQIHCGCGRSRNARTSTSRSTLHWASRLHHLPPPVQLCVWGLGGGGGGELCLLLAGLAVKQNILVVKYITHQTKNNENGFLPHTRREDHCYFFCCCCG